MRPWKRKKVIGRTDCADFPQLKLKKVSVKIDTGAYTSSLHCNSIEEVEIGDKKVIRIVPLDPSHHQFKKGAIEFSEGSAKL